MRNEDSTHNSAERIRTIGVLRNRNDHWRVAMKTESVFRHGRYEGERAVADNERGNQMNDIQLADKIASLLESELEVSITPYDGVGLQFIADFNPDLTEGFLVTVEPYEGA